MKKLSFFLLLFFVVGIFSAQAQRAMKDNITRNLVVVEVKGGTW
jgi:hypothetical protein